MKKLGKDCAMTIRIVTTKGQRDPSGALRRRLAPLGASSTLYLSPGNRAYPYPLSARDKHPESEVVVPTTQSPSLAAVVPRVLPQYAYKIPRTKKVCADAGHPSSRKGQSQWRLSLICPILGLITHFTRGASMNQPAACSAASSAAMACEEISRWIAMNSSGVSSRAPLQGSARIRVWSTPRCPAAAAHRACGHRQERTLR